MNDIPPPPPLHYAEYSSLLWCLAALVVVLTSLVYLGWVQQAQDERMPRKRWGALLICAGTLGTGLCAATVLLLSAEALPFQLGYHAAGAPALWLGAAAGSGLITWRLAQDQRWWVLVGSGALLACIASAAEIGWLLAAGFTPGLHWLASDIARAAAGVAIGLCLALWMAHGPARIKGRWAVLWRLGAALVFGLSLLIGHEIIIAGTDLLKQLDSSHVHDVPSGILLLASGVLLPLVLMGMMLDLALYRRWRPRAGNHPTGMAPRRRRRRRHRIRNI